MKKSLYKAIRKNLFLIPILCFYLIISFLYYQKVGSFSFVDEFNNYVTGYLMHQGRDLYSEIFFNHQMLMAYISYLFQLIINPSTLYELVTYHRVSVLLFSVVMGIFLCVRFRLVGVIFVITYELTKYYFFGNLFLAEAFIVYPLVFLFGVCWEKFQNKTLFVFDYYMAGLFTWFIVFMREPFVPVAIALYGVILWGKLQRSQVISILIFFLLSVISLSSVPLNEYYYQLVTVNAQTVASDEISSNGMQGIGILKIFLYPFFILIQGEWTFLRTFLIPLDILFLTLLAFIGIHYKKIKLVILTIAVLGLCSFRYIEPGTQFYGAYRLLPWYSLFLMTISLMTVMLLKTSKIKLLRFAPMSVLVVIFSYIISSPQFFIYEKVNKEAAFTTQYGRYFSNGELVKKLAAPTDTLFVDGWDSLIFWQAEIPPAYSYSYYYPNMRDIPKYVEAKNFVIDRKPPAFYYHDCISKDSRNFTNTKYARIYFTHMPTCLYIHKSKVSQLTEEQLQYVKMNGYTIN